MMSVVGESGSGKTTLARMILGLTPPTSGAVLYKGNDLRRMSRAEWGQYRREVQAVFQDPYGIYNPFYRIDRVLTLPIAKFRLANFKAEADKLVDESLRAVGLRPADIRGRYPHQLSGGERQRVMLARLYLLRPKLIIADEPVTMIDAAVRSLFLNILLDFKETYGMSCLFITHDLSVSHYLGGDLLIMFRGRAVERGTVDGVLSEPAHPYTRSLVASLPSADPRHRWQDRIESVISGREAAEETQDRCLYAERCPYVTDRCLAERPGVHQVRPGQEAACFLYDAAGHDLPGRAAVTTIRSGD
jgi:peptide/nickel transport system ATP-binding protein